MIHYPGPNADRVVISMNPKAGRSNSAPLTNRFCHECRSMGYGIDLFTNLPAMAEEANRLFRAGRLRCLVGVGGDGTAAELVNRTNPGVPITLLPAGTANLIAKRFRLPKNPVKAAQMIQAGASIVLDAGRMTQTVLEPDGSETERERLFLVVASAGIDADIVRRVHVRREELFQQKAKNGAHIGYRSYIRPIIESLLTYRYPAMRVSVHARRPLGGGAGGECRFTAEPVRWGFFFNIPQYGFGTPPAVGAVPNDRRLDYCFFRRGGFPASIGGIIAAQIQLHRFFPGTGLGTGRGFRLEPVTEGEQIPIEIDGDPAGFLPAAIETVPRRLTLMVPDRTAKRFVQDGEKERRAAGSEAVCRAEWRKAEVEGGIRKLKGE